MQVDNAYVLVRDDECVACGMLIPYGDGMRVRVRVRVGA